MAAEPDVRFAPALVEQASKHSGAHGPITSAPAAAKADEGQHDGDGRVTRSGTPKGAQRATRAGQVGELGHGGQRGYRGKQDAGRRQKPQLHEDRTLVPDRRTV